MGNIKAVRRQSDSCVVGDHVYLVLTRDELVGVVDALHLARDQALEQRFAAILYQLPPPLLDNWVTFRPRPGLTESS